MTLSNESKVARYRCLESVMFFTRYCFKQKTGRKFVIGEHHLKIAAALDRVLRGECRRLIINIAPRYGKTELAVKNFIAAGLALNPAAKFIHLSYSDNLALDNSEEVRDMVQESWFKAIFPEVIIKKDSKGKKKWYTSQGGGVYATSTRGQITGFGAGLVDEESEEEDPANWPNDRPIGNPIKNQEALEIYGEEEEKADLSEFIPIWEQGKPFGGAIIIDDSIKPEDANSELLRNKVNERYDNTIVSRVNSRDTPIVIIQQRVHPKDLCGYVMDNEPGEWEILSLPCIKEDGTALWPHKHTIKELNKMWLRLAGVFESQYLQNPKPIEGLLYKSLRTYKVLPPGDWPLKAVIDTADTGADYLCCIVYLATKSGYYIIDVYYTQDGVETTEPETATLLSKHQVKNVLVESNNGGKGFARAVEKICREMENRRTAFKWFHQSQNKHVRIYNGAAIVQNMVYFPEGWAQMWPAFYKSITGYLAKGKNLHDDAEDTLTMITEAEKVKKTGSKAADN
jgi:predicted phage terminase large subunit-like protein